MSTSGKYSKTIDAELNLKIAKIQDIFEEIVKDVSIPESGEIVAFIGPTKAGKSTLINCLMGNALIWKKNPFTEDVIIDKENSEPGPVIGSNGESETVFPKAYTTLPGTTFPMWDFPGFCDNKGSEQEIANAAAYERVLKIQKSIRFVLVVPIDFIKNSNPLPFFKLLYDIALICPMVADSLCIVATKSEKGTVSAWLESAFGTRFDKANSENIAIINKGKSVIQSVLRNNHCIDFKAPIAEEDALEGEFFLPNVENIASLIKDLAGSTVGEFPLVISDQAKSEIQQLYIWYNKKLACEINVVCEGFDNFIQDKIDIHSNYEGGDGKSGISTLRLSFFLKNMEIIKELQKNTSDCKGFISGVEKLGFHLPTLAENIEKFIFIEEIQNMYKLKDQEVMNGEKEFLKTIMITINSVKNKCWDLIKHTEIAIAEEQRLARVYDEQRARDIAEKEEHLKKVNKERERERAENEEHRNKVNEERAREFAENEKRNKMMDEEREREKAQNARRMFEIDQERKRERALDKERRKIRDEERAREISEYENRKKIMDQEMERERSDFNKNMMKMKEQIEIANKENAERLKVMEEKARETAEEKRRLDERQNHVMEAIKQKSRLYAEHNKRMYDKELREREIEESNQRIREREKSAKKVAMFEQHMRERDQEMSERGVDLQNRERVLQDLMARQERDNQQRKLEDEQKEKKREELENDTRQVNDKATKVLAGIERLKSKDEQMTKERAENQKSSIGRLNDEAMKIQADIKNLKIENEQRAKEIKEVGEKTDIARRMAENAKPKIVNTQINMTQNFLLVDNDGRAFVRDERPNRVTSACTSGTIEDFPSEHSEDEESVVPFKITRSSPF